MLADPEVRELILETFGSLDIAINSAISTETPPELTAALRNNAFIFSGFKTYHSLSEVGLALTDPDGSVKPYDRFRRDVQAIDKKYNTNYLYAEYNHAVRSSQMAVKWNDAVRDGDRYLLQYRTAGDERVREAHAALNGVTLPPSDPFWDSYYPPNGWNCRCTVVQVLRDDYRQSDSAAAIAAGEACTSEPKQRIFRYNPGKTLTIMPPKHPYYKVPDSVKEKVEALAEERKREEVAQRRKEIKKEMASHIDVTLSHPDFPLAVSLSMGAIKEFLNQPHSHYKEKNELLLDIANVFRNARYLGINPRYEREGLAASHIFEIVLCGEKSWLVVREYNDKRCILYSCSDSPGIANGLK